MTWRAQNRPKLPSGAIELYNLYIHGEIGRREFMDGVKRFATKAALRWQRLSKTLMPNYAQGQQVAEERRPDQGQLRDRSFSAGQWQHRGYFVRPVSADTRSPMPTKLPGVIVVHENRDLNPHIEDIARRFALANFMAFAPDGLTSLGGFPGDDYKGGQMFSKVDGKKMMEDMVASAMWLKGRADCTGKICATGFCYGGGVANNLAFRLGADLAAAAPFYGGVHGRQRYSEDQRRDPGTSRRARHAACRVVADYDAALTAIKVPHESYILSERRAWVQLRRYAGTLQQSGGGSRLAADYRLV